MNKYDGTSCLKSRLKYYLRKMARYSDNMPLLISTFQDSLKGVALAWYTALNIEDFTKWDHLVGGRIPLSIQIQCRSTSNPRRLSQNQETKKQMI